MDRLTRERGPEVVARVGDKSADHDGKRIKMTPIHPTWEYPVEAWPST
jgi:hypothetical protein